LEGVVTDVALLDTGANITDIIHMSDGEKNRYIMELLTKNSELKDAIIEQQDQHCKSLTNLIPKIGDTTNVFNLQIFLNEECRDAMNITDFIKSLDVTVADLETTRTKGLLESVKHQMLCGLNSLKQEERPVHCTDVSKKEMYVKDSGGWEKDFNYDKIKAAANLISHKQMQNISKWEDAKSWSSSIASMDQYVDIVNSLTKTIDNKGVCKIVGNLSTITKIQVIK